MASTTNYSWTTPDDTALVKDGAAAIRSLGSSIDTTTKALNPSTTLGDIEYRSATANTNTRLPIGTSGQLLAVNGSGVPAWTTVTSGGMTQIATGSLNTGAGAVTTISSIPQTYKNLLLTLTDYTASGAWTMLRINADSGTKYYGSGIYSISKTNGDTANTATMMILDRIRNYGTGYAASGGGSGQFIIYNYAVSQKMHSIAATGTSYIDASTGSAGVQHWGHYKSTAAAVTEINIYPESTATYTHSGTYTLWGLS